LLFAGGKPSALGRFRAGIEQEDASATLIGNGQLLYVL
jgi:hypothetical protein